MSPLTMEKVCSFCIHVHAYMYVHVHVHAFVSWEALQIKRTASKYVLSKPEPRYV